MSSPDFKFRRTAFPGRREVTTPRDGLGRPSYESSLPFGKFVTKFQINLSRRAQRELAQQLFQRFLRITLGRFWSDD